MSKDIKIQVEIIILIDNISANFVQVFYINKGNLRWSNISLLDKR